MRAGFNLDNLAQTDVDNIVSEFAANVNHTVVAPARNYYNPEEEYMLEAGLVTGQTSTPRIDKLVQQQNDGDDLKQIYNAGAVFGLAWRHGLALEAVVLPNIGNGQIWFYNYSGAVKWTFTDVFYEAFRWRYKEWFPVDAAARFAGQFSRLQANFDVNNATTGSLTLPSTVTYKNLSFNGSIMISKRFYEFYEPYAGFGYVWTRGTLNIDSAFSDAVNIFDIEGISSQQDVKSIQTSMMATLGLALHYFNWSLAGEWTRAFATNRIAVKFTAIF